MRFPVEQLFLNRWYKRAIAFTSGNKYFCIVKIGAIILTRDEFYAWMGIGRLITNLNRFVKEAFQR